MARRLCAETSYPWQLLGVAGYGLSDATRLLPAEPLGEESWSSIKSSARTHRMTGPLSAAIDSGAFPATDVQAEQARAAHMAAMVWVLSLERELLIVIDLLTQADVETRILKGTAVAHLDYSNPSLRSFIDLDILLRAEDFDRAVRTLIAAGFIRRLSEPRPGFDQRFDKGTTLVGAAGYELDLHRTFVLGPWGLLVDLNDLWDRGEEVVIGGRSLRALSRYNRLLHACYHAALGDWPLRLGSLRDVAEMTCPATVTRRWSGHWPRIGGRRRWSPLRSPTRGGSSASGPRLNSRRGRGATFPPGRMSRRWPCTPARTRRSQRKPCPRSSRCPDFETKPRTSAR